MCMFEFVTIAPIGMASPLPGRIPGTLQRFTLFESPSKMYLVAGSKARSGYRILTLDRAPTSDGSLLQAVEDPALLSFDDCMARVQALEQLHQAEGGLSRTGRFEALMGFTRFCTVLLTFLQRHRPLVQ